MTEKKRLQIFYPKDFVKIIKSGQQTLLVTQKEHKRFFLNKIPTPISIGNEIEFRFQQYKELKELLIKIINDFIPERDRERYLALIPQSPIEILCKNGYGTRDNI